MSEEASESLTRVRSEYGVLLAELHSSIDFGPKAIGFLMKNGVSVFFNIDDIPFQPEPMSTLNNTISIALSNLPYVVSGISISDKEAMIIADAENGFSIEIGIDPRTANTTFRLAQPPDRRLLKQPASKLPAQVDLLQEFIAFVKNVRDISPESIEPELG